MYWPKDQIFKNEIKILLVDNGNDDETEHYLLKRETEYENLSPAVTEDHFASTYDDMSSWALAASEILPCSNNEGYPVQTSQMSPLIHEVNEKPGPQFTHLHLLLISTVS